MERRRKHSDGSAGSAVNWTGRGARLFACTLAMTAYSAVDVAHAQSGAQPETTSASQPASAPSPVPATAASTQPSETKSPSASTQPEGSKSSEANKTSTQPGAPPAGKSTFSAQEKSTQRDPTSGSDSDASGAAETSEDGVSLAERMESLAARATEVGDLRARAQTLDPDARELLLPQVYEADERYWQQLLSLAEELARPADAEEADKAEVQKAKSDVLQRLVAEEKRIFDQIAKNQKQLLDFRSKSSEASEEERARLLAERNERMKRAPVLFGALDAQLDAREALGSSIKPSVELFKRKIAESSQLVGAALHKISDQITHLSQGAEGAEDPTQADQKAELTEARNLLSELQKKQLSLMDKREMDTAQLRQDLIRYTGEISEDILNVEVAKGLVESLKDDALTWFKENAGAIAFKSVSFLLILLLFAGLSRVARWLTSRAVKNSRQLSSLAAEFLVKSVGRLVALSGWMVAAAQVGIEVGPVLAGLGIAGFVLGFALQSTLSNFASGMMILVYRPFDVGDAVDAGGVLGKVHAMNLVSTAIITFDNQMLMVPNNKIWGDVIRNLTHQANRRVDMVFGIAYSDDIDHARRVFEDILEKHEMVLSDPVPVVRLHELGDSSVNFVVRPWVRTEDYWEAYWDIHRQVKKRLDEEGISIPFPQRDVHVHATAAETAILESHRAPAKTADE